MKIGRNEPCHCGSGKKYKHCHEAKKQSQNNQYYIIGIIAIVIIAAISINTGESNSVQNTPVSPKPLLNQSPLSKSSKPSATAPPGKVWSSEHGHWHDAPKTNSLSSPRLNTNTPLPNKSKPAGETPPGKVWSDEHGHWHDEPGNKSLAPKKSDKTDGNKITIPQMDKDNPPDGKVWNEEHGHFHDKE